MTIKENQEFVKVLLLMKEQIEGSFIEIGDAIDEHSSMKNMTV